jgi:hypothetical protein
LRFIVAIKASRESRLHRGYRQQTVDEGEEWTPYNPRAAWMFAAMVM